MALADWDPRLIAPERALHMAGDWPVYYTAEVSRLSGNLAGEPDQVQINQRCGKCQQSITMLAHGTDLAAPQLAGPPTTPADQLSDVLRHMVTAHDWSLSGAHNG